MKLSKPKLSNVIFLVVLLLLIIPQTRKPIQIFINKGLALFSPSVITTDKQKAITDYHWTLKDANDNTFDFKSAKGKVVFLNFWATWCPPCIAEMPSIEALYKDYQDKIVFVLVSDEKHSVVSNFLKDHGYTFNTYNPVSQYPEAFNIRSIPRTFLIDQKGNIVIDKNGAANWNSETVRNTINDLLQQ